jgi:hypothetical protein
MFLGQREKKPWIAVYGEEQRILNFLSLSPVFKKSFWKMKRKQNE